MSENVEAQSVPLEQKSVAELVYIIGMYSRDAKADGDRIRVSQARIAELEAKLAAAETRLAQAEGLCERKVLEAKMNEVFEILTQAEGTLQVATRKWLEEREEDYDRKLAVLATPPASPSGETRE